MKNTLFIVVLILFYSCNKPSNNISDTIKTDFSKYNEAYNEAAKSPMIVDTIFLGLRFGMTEKEVNSYLKEMKKKGKISINGLGKYEYILTTKDASIKSSLNADYFKGKLYKFSIIFEEYGINGTFIPMNQEVMVNGAKNAFLGKTYINKEKFSRYYYNLEGLGKYSCFINNNLIVEFSPLGSMSYINAPIERQKEMQKSEHKKKKALNTMSDL